MGVSEDGIPILHFNEAKDILQKYKIIVTTAEYHYKEIKKQLEKFGLEENINFIMYHQSFIME